LSKTRTQAELALSAVARAMVRGESVMNYGDLAESIGRGRGEGRLIGPVLDELARICRDSGLPDAATVVCTGESIASGNPMPSDAAFVDSRTKVTGIARVDIAAEQARVRSYPWLDLMSVTLPPGR